MIVASGSTASEMVLAASATSWRVSELPPVMLIRQPLAPSTEASSSRGDDMAPCAASRARLSPDATPVPITAMPWPHMIARTSPKSAFTSPGIVIRSLMPCTDCRRTSSAVTKASASDVPRSTKLSSRSFGIAITVSTALCSSSSPRSASIIRRRPSNAKGFVTTATVRAPTSADREPMMGTAPVPVPPPRPAARKTMSAPFSMSRILSVSSSAELRPTSGSAPAPRPRVILRPSCSFVGASQRRKACKSVLAAMNSMPPRLAAIIRLTAFPPPPPTPTTTILAGPKLSPDETSSSIVGVTSVGCCSSIRIMVPSISNPGSSDSSNSNQTRSLNIWRRLPITERTPPRERRRAMGRRASSEATA